MIVYLVHSAADNVRHGFPSEGLAAPHGEKSLTMQRTKDSNRPPLWRLTNPLGRLGKGIRYKKILKNNERSHYMYENKGNMDTMPGEKSDNYVRMTCF